MDYPLIAHGERDYLIHNGTYPWDHWSGILLLAELGGRVAFLDGEPFTSCRPKSKRRKKRLLVTRRAPAPSRRRSPRLVPNPPGCR